MQAFRNSTTTTPLTYGTVLAVLGSQLRVRVGPSAFICSVTAPLSLCRIRIGDIVFLTEVRDRIYATAIARAESFASLSTADGGSGDTVIISASSLPFDDAHLLARSGTRPLLAAARWEWEIGAEVASVFRSQGPGLLQVIDSLYAGKREGGHVGLFEYQTENSIETASVLQGVDSGNVPFFSVDIRHDANANSAAVTIGRAGLPQIAFGPLAGCEYDVPLVDTRLLSGVIPGSQIDTTTLTLPVVTSLDGLHFEEPTLFELRLGDDSGALYMWTRWGPEPIGGYHCAGPHNHETFQEGDLLAQVATHEAPDTDSGPTALHHTLGVGAEQAAAGNHAHSIAKRVETATYTEVAGDHLIVCNADSVAMTVNLLPATGSGRPLIIKSIGASTVTVDGADADTLDGGSTRTLAQWGTLRIIDYISGKWVIV